MARHFVFGIANTDSIADTLVVAHLKALNLNWWHWLPNYWLVIDNADTHTCASLRRSLDTLLPQVNKLVLEVQPIDWAGLGPRNDKQNMFLWLQEYWIPPHRITTPMPPPLGLPPLPGK